MKLLTLITLGLAALVAADNKSACRNKHPKVFEAINRFCASSNMVVPSRYTKNGVGYQGARVKIVGAAGNGCNPPQWVPSGICFGQFYSICAASWNRRTYGRNACQAWKVTYAMKRPGPKVQKTPAQLLAEGFNIDKRKAAGEEIDDVVEGDGYDHTEQ